MSRPPPRPTTGPRRGAAVGGSPRPGTRGTSTPRSFATASTTSLVASSTDTVLADAVLLSFGVIFIAELGDKSQLMALAFATRFPAGAVLIAITIATALVHLGSVVLGATVAAVLPTKLV